MGLARTLAIAVLVIAAASAQSPEDELRAAVRYMPLQNKRGFRAIFI
jgi:hypothetical protein